MTDLVQQACIVGIGETRYTKWGQMADRGEWSLAWDAVLIKNPCLEERKSMRSYFLVVLGLMSLGWGAKATAQPAILDKPLQLRVTGEVLPAKEQPSEDIVTANITVLDKPMLLRVGKVEELTFTEREQAVKWGVLFRQVRFYGPTPLLEQIKKAEGTGHALTIEGHLDTRVRQFLVTSVKE